MVIFLKILKPDYPPLPKQTQTVIVHGIVLINQNTYYHLEITVYIRGPNNKVSSVTRFELSNHSVIKTNITLPLAILENLLKCGRSYRVLLESSLSEGFIVGHNIKNIKGE